MARSLKLVALGLVPFLYVAAGLALKASRGPYWLGTNADPEYAYLFNALLIASGRAPFHVDHPGTPVQMIGAVVLRAISAVAGRGTLADDVVARPEMYLAAMHATLLAIVAVLIFAAGLIVLRRTQHVALALIIQLAPWLFLVTPAELSRVRPEPILIALSTVFAAALYAATEDTSRRDAVTLGVIAGVAIACKVTALPLLLGPLLAFASWRSRRRFLETTALAFLVGIIAAWPRVLSMGKWLAMLLVHADGYGGGPVSVIDTARYLPSLRGLAAAEPLVVLTMACGALLWLAGQERRVLGAALVVQVAQFFMVAKHPGVHYLAPAAGMLGITWCAGWRFLSARGPSRMRHLALASVVGVFVFVTMHDRSQAAAMRDLRDDQAKTAETARAAAQSSDCVTVYAYESSSEAFALQFGNLWSKFPGITATLSARYPHVAFDRSRLSLRDFSWEKDLDRPQFLRDHPCVLRQGLPVDAATVPQDVALDTLYIGQHETVYRLRAR